MSETAYATFLADRPDGRPDGPSALIPTRKRTSPAVVVDETTPGNPASDFALPDALKLAVRQYAEDVASKVVTALSDEKTAAAFHERMRTDLAFKSAFLSRVVQYAAKHGLTEAAAAAPVLAEIVKES